MHKIELTDEQINVVGAALAELPYKVAAPVVATIQAQLSAAASTSAAEKVEDRAEDPVA